MTVRAASRRYKILKFAVLFVVIPFVLYTIAGFWLLPRLIKQKLPGIIEQYSGRTASVDRIEINPYLLTLQVQGFKMQQRKGDARFAQFDHLFGDLAWASIQRRALVFEKVSCAGLFVEIDRFKDKTLNIDDLLKLAGSKDSRPKQESAIFPIVIDQLDLQEAHLQLDDRSRNSPFRAQIAPIDLSMSNVRTNSGQTAKFRVKAGFNGEAKLEWFGELGIAPFRSEGRLQLSRFPLLTAWQTIQDFVNFEITDGTFWLDANYVLDYRGDAMQLRASRGQSSFDRFKLVRKGDADPLIEIPRLKLEGIDFDLLGRKLAIASATSAQAKVHAWVRPDKEMNFIDLFVPVADPKSAKVSSPQPHSASNETPWSFSIRELVIEDHAFLFEDRSLKKPFKLNFEPLDIRLENFSSNQNNSLPFTIKTTVNTTGYLNVKGNLDLTPLSTQARLDLKLNLTDFQPYIDPVTKFEFGRGDANVKGDVDFQFDATARHRLKFKGQARIDDFVGQDKGKDQKLLGWESLTFDGVDFNLHPLEVAIQDVLADRLYLNFMINADGSTNLSRIFGAQSSSQSTSEKPKQSQPRSEKTPPDAVVRVDRLKIQDTAVDFADQSLNPGFSTSMDALNGVIQGFSTNPQAKATIDLKGNADGSATVHIQGKLQPLDPERYSDVSLKFKNLSLTSLNPYSRKFVGYRIKKGKLAVELAYHIENKKLVGTNQFVIKQLTLGERVESPNALTLPLTLAVALLKDKDGVINLDLPIRGSLEDPEFDVWGTVGDLFVNMITKSVTSPFTALAALIGSDEELDHIAFSPGQADLKETELEKLAQIAESLAERPTLDLEIKGIANEKDAESKFRDAILAKKTKPGSSDGQDLAQLGEKEFNRHLLQSYYTLITHMNEIALDAPMIERDLNSEEALSNARRRVYSSMLSDDSAFRDLAKGRVENVRKYLVSKGLDEERIFLVDSELKLKETSEEDSNQQVHLPLSVTTH